MKPTDEKYERTYAKAALRAALVSLFWGVIRERKKRGGFTMQALAKAIGSTKHEVSRWFNGDPNWTLNTIGNLAHALDLDLIVQARERSTGLIFTSSGIQSEPSVQNQLGGSIATSAMVPSTPYTIIRFPKQVVDLSGKPRRLDPRDIPTAWAA